MPKLYAILQLVSAPLNPIAIAHFRITLHCRQTETSSRGQVLKVQEMYEKLTLSLDLKVLFVSSGA